MFAVFLSGSLCPFSEHTHALALIRTLAQARWNGANIDSIWARQISPPSCVLSLSLSFTLAQFLSNLPLPLSLEFPFILFLVLPFFSLPLCPRLSVSPSLPLLFSRLLRLSVLLGQASQPFTDLDPLRLESRRKASLDFTLPTPPVCWTTCYCLKPTYFCICESENMHRRSVKSFVKACANTLSCNVHICCSQLLHRNRKKVLENLF